MRVVMVGQISDVTQIASFLAVLSPTFFYDQHKKFAFCVNFVVVSLFII